MRAAVYKSEIEGERPKRESKRTTTQKKYTHLLKQEERKGKRTSSSLFL
jgi:hypothetical protein